MSIAQFLPVDAFIQSYWHAFKKLTEKFIKLAQQHVSTRLKREFVPYVFLLLCTFFSKQK